MDIKKRFPLKRNIFNRLLLTSSITIIATVSILFIMITNYYSNVIIQREMDLNSRTLERADDYFAVMEQDVTSMIRELYGKNDLAEDLSYALQNGYEDYLRYRLDRYADSPVFVPIDINLFFKSYFNQHEDVNALRLYSLESPSTEYLFIYNYSRWNRSVVSNSVEEKKSSAKELQDTFTITRSLQNPVTRKIIGSLSVYFTTEKLNEIFDKRSKVNSTTFLLNENGEALYASNRDVPLTIVQGLPHETGESVIKWKGSKYYINVVVGSSGYTYFGIIPEKELNNVTIVKGTMGVLIAFSIFMAIFITYSFMRNYSSRINHIDSSIREVEKGNLNIRIRKFKQKDELSTISNSINSMLDELNNYIDRFYVLNIKQQQAELKALQSQINPHFLFNTLEVIRMAAILEGSKTSSKMIYHLSRLFRYTLESKEMVPLHTEVEHTNQYLQLMQLHHPNKLEVVVDIPKEFENILIQKLILQPIIENYMIHGFRKDKKNNRLVIQATNVNNDIHIDVKDNGLGLSPERLNEVVSHLNDESDIIQSIGLKNVNQRLKLKYGEGYGLTIQSEEDVETIVTIVIPLGGISYV